MSVGTTTVMHVWSHTCTVLLVSCLLGGVVCEPAQGPGSLYGAPSDASCLDFSFNDCDFHQRMCGSDKAIQGNWNIGNIFWKSGLTNGPSGQRRGVLMIETNTDVHSLKVSLGLKQLRGWSFGVTELHEFGQIPRPANGIAAEVHNNGKDLMVYENVPEGDDFAQSAWRIPLNLFEDYFDGSANATRFDLTMTRDYMLMDTHPHIRGTQVVFQHKPLFNFTYGFAIGLNRDPSEPLAEGTTGSGVYAICVKFNSFLLNKAGD